MWEQPAGASSEDNEMGTTILGDVTHPTPVVVAGGNDSSVGKMLTGAALGMSLLGVPGAGVAGYLLSKMQQPTQQQPALPPQVNDGETVDLGLSKFEDLNP